MSLVGIFSKSQPEIPAGYAFDAALKERTDLSTDVTEFPIENGTVGNDHAVRRPLRLSMTVGISDNAFRALSAALPVGGGIAAGLGVGAGLGQLSGDLAALAGIGGSVGNAAFAAGQATSRSQAALEFVRDLQTRALPIDVVTSRKMYRDCLITSTRQETTKENEQGLILVVEMKQLIVVSDSPRQPIPAPGDTAETQAQPTRDLGRLVPR